MAACNTQRGAVHGCRLRENFTLMSFECLNINQIQFTALAANKENIHSYLQPLMLDKSRA